MKDLTEPTLNGAVEPEAQFVSGAALPLTDDRFPLPAPRRVRRRLVRAWLIGLTIFGYGPAITYGQLAWLFNEHQWYWTYLLYFTEVPLVGGLCVLVLPWIWYRPIHDALVDWTSGVPVDRARCAAIYEQAIHLPWRLAVAAFSAGFVGYVIGFSVLHWQANQPWIEIAKTLPAIPLVGGMMGAFCYFATARALYPVLAWCSVQLRYARPTRRVSLAEKFLATVCVLMIATLCLLQPAAYSMGQTVTEHHLKERALTRLQNAAHRMQLFNRLQDQFPVLQQAVLGREGYALVLDAQGRALTPHPRGFTHIDQERFYKFWERAGGSEGSWVDRFGRHRVVAFIRLRDPSRLLVSVAFPSDFALPLNHYMQFAWLAMLEVLLVLFIFGRYFTRSITTPLGDLTRTAQRIAEHGDLTQHVPVTTNDELGEVALSFNRMMQQLQASQADLEEYTKRLERSTQELSMLNQEMEDLLRVVSHDLRAPLINIQGFSQRLEPLMAQTLRRLEELAVRQGADEAQRAQIEALKTSVQARFSESLRFIGKGVEKMDVLLSSLLAVSRVGRKADVMQPNDLNGILDDVLATFDHQLKERAIDVIRQPLPPRVPCRRNEINQVFSNLLANAINYMGPTGRRFIEIGGTEHPDRVECYVRDTGIGINPEDQERVFQMFMRLQAVDVPGEGVGLAYVRKILRSHGGKIWVVSQKGQGSTFFFSLPATRG